MRAIDVEHLFFSYPDRNVLRDISISVNEGEFVGIIGPNGGGKTTLLKLILGFLKPDSGFVKVFGEAPRTVCKQIAYVPQTARFDRQFPISVMELVLSGRLSRLPWHGRFSADDRKRAIEALEKVHLADMKDASFGNLSGGQAQRALIARALVAEPKLLLLDEPTASVDTQAETDIYGILENLRGSITILMVTHDLNAVIDRVDRVICVQNTALVLKPEEVCQHFAIGLYHGPLIKIKS